MKKCRRCGAKTYKKICEFKLKKLKKDYFYTACFMCPKCNTIYLDEQFKIKTDQIIKQLGLNDY